MTAVAQEFRPNTARITDDAQALAAAQELAPRFAQEAADRDRLRRLPYEELELFSQSGLWGITVPKEYGGAGVSAITLVQVIRRIAQADSSLAHIPQNHFYALEVLRVNGRHEQKQRLYAEVLSGARFGNAHAELNTRAAHERTTALTQDAQGYRIDGRKFYATGALFADRIPTSVTDDQGRVYFAFVPRHTSGLTFIDDWSGFGQRTSGSGSVVFEQVRVASEDLIPFQSAFERPTAVGPFAQILHAAIDIGIAQAAYEDALAFVRTRSRPWIDAGVEQAVDDPLTLNLIGQLSVRLQAAEALLLKSARILEIARQEPNTERVAEASIAVAKARAITTEVALATSSTLFELAGSRATLGEYNLDRHWRNARTHTLHDPVRWKYHAIGNYYLNEVLPPRRGTL